LNVERYLRQHVSSIKVKFSLRKPSNFNFVKALLQKNRIPAIVKATWLSIILGYKIQY